MLRLGDSKRPYENFINSIDSEYTKRSYKYHLGKFMARQPKLTVQAFLQLPINQIEEMIIDYIIDLKKEGLSSIYIHLKLSALRHLCIMNDVRINTEKIAKFIGERIKKNTDRAYNHAEIKQVADASDLRIRCMILLLSSTGIRIGAVPLLKLKHLEKLDSLYKITIYENTRDQYFTFCTPETAECIDSYLEYRKRCGEKLTGESFLIRNQFNMNDLEQIRKYSRGVSRSSLLCLLNIRLVKSGLRVINHTYTGKQRHPISMAHGFRKFFTTQLVNSRINPEIREMLLGHSIGLASAYYKPTEEEMLEEYMKGVDNLTINPENRLKRKVEKLEVEASQLQRLQAAVKALEMKINK